MIKAFKRRYPRLKSKRKTEVFLGLGGNIGNTEQILKKAMEAIVQLPGVSNLSSSRFYCTTPVSSIPQGNFVNAVFIVKTNLTARKLMTSLQEIECFLGKVPKGRDDPRPVDIDILFFGQEVHADPDLTIPHARWKERLFVLRPLLDLVEKLVIPTVNKTENLQEIDLRNFVADFTNPHNEEVYLLNLEGC
jgi:2-amino-4-hydroxy-6-hydroxymethyldihydropteridine diphosphokinase